MQRRDFIAGTSLLLGGLSASGLANALAGKVDVARSTRTVRRTLTREQLAMINTLSDLVIPRTDTPGAVDAGVPEFLEHIVSSWYTDTEFAVFVDGLAWLGRAARERFGRGYVACSAGEQTRLLEEMEVQARDYHRAHPAKVTTDSVMGKGAIDQHAPFFTKLKELVVVGYYTSELAATTEIIYLPVPMKYAGEATLAESGGKQYIW